MGYHVNEIKRGVLGGASKIREELEELEDALQQGNAVMAIQEAADMLGAIEAWVERFNLNINDLVVMMRATQRAFKDGTRVSREEL